MSNHNTTLSKSNPSITFLRAEFVENMADVDYRNNDGLNQSYLKRIHLFGTPKANVKDDEQTKAMIIGSAFHCLTLEHHNYASKFSVCPKVDRRTTIGKETYARHEAESVGKTVIMQDDHDLAVRMALSASAIALAGCYGKDRMLNKHTKTELAFTANAKLSYTWDGSEQYEPVQLKGRIDILTTDQDGEPVIRDLKSIETLGDKEVSFAAKDGCWAIHSAFYSDVVQQITGKKPKFEYYATEKGDPTFTRQFDVAEEMIARGRNQYLNALVNHFEWVRNGKPSTYDYQGPTILNV